MPDSGGARARIAQLGALWADAAGLVADVPDAGSVPSALDDLVDAAVTRYATWAPAEPTMLVHMATAPRAARLVLPALPERLWLATYRHAWSISAAIAAMYRPRHQRDDEADKTKELKRIQRSRRCGRDPR